MHKCTHRRHGYIWKIPHIAHGCCLLDVTSTLESGKNRLNTYMNADLIVVYSGHCEIVVADICPCLKCKVGFCLFRYFRGSK